MSYVSPRRQLADHSRRVARSMDGFRVFGGTWAKPWVCYAMSPLLNRLRAGRTAQFDSFNARWGECDLYTFANLFEDYPVDSITESLRSVEMVIDLGANVGAFSWMTLELLRRNDLNLPIVAVEPNEANFTFLGQQPFARAVTIHHAAVGPTSGSARLIRGVNSVSDHVDFSGTMAGKSIPVLSLASLCERPALVKMDIEGGEWEILERGLPSNLRHLVLEWHSRGDSKETTTPADIVPGNWQLISNDIYGSTMWYFQR